MDQITDLKTVECDRSIYVRPFRLSYKQDGIPKTWDVIKSHDCVTIIVFNVTRKVITLVRQFRPGIYYEAIRPEDRNGPVDPSRYPGTLGLTLELCAGIVDKKLPLQEVAREEVLEECGYDVASTALQRLVTCKSSVGLSGTEMTMFYVEVTDDQRVSGGGGNAKEGEYIEVVEMTIPEVRQYLKQDNLCTTMSMLYGLTWFLNNKAPEFEGSS